MSLGVLLPPSLISCSTLDSHHYFRGAVWVAREILGLRWRNVDLENGSFSVVEQLPFGLPAGTLDVSEMAPVKAGDRSQVIHYTYLSGISPRFTVFPMLCLGDPVQSGFTVSAYQFASKQLF